MIFGLENHFLVFFEWPIKTGFFFYCILILVTGSLDKTVTADKAKTNPTAPAKESPSSFYKLSVSVVIIVSIREMLEIFKHYS